MDSSDSTLTRFFQRYGTALATGDLPGIAHCYAYPSLAVADAASVVIESQEAVQAAFQGAAEGYRAQGLVAAVASFERTDHLSDALCEVTIRWSYRDDSGSERQSERYRYLIRRQDDEWSISVVTALPASGASATAEHTVPGSRGQQ